VESIDQIDQCLNTVTPRLPIAVAYSGGADSTFLLHLCVKKWPKAVVAWHINHQLQEAASDFEVHCQTECASLHIPLHIEPVQAGATNGQSPEEAARNARYEAFQKMALISHNGSAIRTVFVAQHGDDQIETFLLALTRGAGLAGLSSMPKKWTKNGIDYQRPLLSMSALGIRTWLHDNDIAFIEDPSNTDIRYTRNRIRHQLIPSLANNFPHYRQVIARSIGHIAQSADLLNELAQEDLKKISINDTNQIILSEAQKFSPARLSNTLRYWLKSQHQTIASQAQIHELIAQITDCTTRGHKLHIKIGNGFAIRQESALAWVQSNVYLKVLK
jgi:tRNA(Ile)-lysidine synthase